MSLVIIPELRKIMGDSVYGLFTVDYVNLACNLGTNGAKECNNINNNDIRSLIDVVTKIVKWYSKAKVTTKIKHGNEIGVGIKGRKKVDDYMDKCDNAYIKQLWTEFKIMFIDNDNLDQVNKLAIKMKTGYICKSLNPTLKEISLYQLWSGQVKVTTNNLSPDTTWLIHYVY
jgi:hypothetical protein